MRLNEAPLTSLILGSHLDRVTVRVPLTAPIPRSCRPSRRVSALFKVNVRIVNARAADNRVSLFICVGLLSTTAFAFILRTGLPQLQLGY